VELSQGPAAFSDLIGKRAEDQRGRSLGRVYEVRARWEKEQIIFEELLVGPRALLRRLRGPGAEIRGFPWEAVATVGADRIVVRW
jgi:sporulation protein YlmC with PRC-barrel domain